MNLKVVYATLAGAVYSFLLGWVVYGLLLMNFYTSNIIHYEGLMKAEPNLVLIFLSCIAMSYLVAFVFDQWAGIRTLVKGLYGGFIIGLLMGLVNDLSFLAMMNLYSIKVMVVDIILYGVINAGLGGVIALVLGMGKKPAEG